MVTGYEVDYYQDIKSIADSLKEMNRLLKRILEKMD